MADKGFGLAVELFLSILVDLIGIVSYLIPLAGETTDIVTAPLNVAWILEMFDDFEEDVPYDEFIAGLGGLEEIAPFIDIIPSATIAWTIKWYVYK